MSVNLIKQRKFNKFIHLTLSVRTLQRAFSRGNSYNSLPVSHRKTTSSFDFNVHICTYFKCNMISHVQPTYGRPTIVLDLAHSSGIRGEVVFQQDKPTSKSSRKTFQLIYNCRLRLLSREFVNTNVFSRSCFLGHGLEHFPL